MVQPGGSIPPLAKKNILQVYDYCCAYAEKFGLREHVRFGKRLTKIEPLDPTGELAPIHHQWASAKLAMLLSVPFLLDFLCVSVSPHLSCLSICLQ
jgi:hypothetical protein